MIRHDTYMAVSEKGTPNSVCGSNRFPLSQCTVWGIHGFPLSRQTSQFSVYVEKQQQQQQQQQQQPILSSTNIPLVRMLVG